MIVDALNAASLTAQVSKQQRYSRHRSEQDELLAQGVERADIEVERGDDVRGIAQLRLDPVDQQPVDPVVVAEGGEPVQANQQYRAETGSGEREHPEADAPAHRCSSSSPDRSCEASL